MGGRLTAGADVDRATVRRDDVRIPGSGWRTRVRRHHLHTSTVSVTVPFRKWRGERTLPGLSFWALVYQRSQHFINLFVWPSDSRDITQQEQLARQGYNLIHWTRSGITYWLISELNLTELNECARLLKE